MNAIIGHKISNVNKDLLFNDKFLRIDFCPGHKPAVRANFQPLFFPERLVLLEALEELFEDTEDGGAQADAFGFGAFLELEPNLCAEVEELRVGKLHAGLAGPHDVCVFALDLAQSKKGDPGRIALYARLFDDCFAQIDLLRLRNRYPGRSRLRRRCRLGLGGVLLLCRRQNGVQDGALHARHELHNSRLANVLDEAVDDGVAQFAVGHLPAPEAQAGLYLVAVHQEANRLILLGLVVVLVHGH